MDSFFRVIDANDCIYGRLEEEKIGLPNTLRLIGNWQKNGETGPMPRTGSAPQAN